MITKANIECPDCGWMCLVEGDKVFCQNSDCMVDGKFKRIEPND